MLEKILCKTSGAKPKAHQKPDQELMTEGVKVAKQPPWVRTGTSSTVTISESLASKPQKSAQFNSRV